MSSNPVSSKSTAATAHALWQKQPKANAELFALTYGALVGELLRDLEDSSQVAAELDRMGHSVGVRCMEEVLAKLALQAAEDGSTRTFGESTDVLKVAFRMFFGIAVEATTVKRDENGTSSYSIKFAENPLDIFVELPPERQDLEYSQLLAGMLRGMLEMLQFDCSVKVVQTVLAGNETNELSVELKQVLQEGAGEDYQEE
jgi:hypothetical protein